MPLTELLSQHATQRRQEALQRFQLLAQQYAAGNVEPMPNEILEVLEACGRSAAELEAAIEAERAKLAADEQSRLDAEAQREQAARDERARLVELSDTEPEIREAIDCCRANLADAADKLAEIIAPWEAAIESARAQHAAHVAKIQSTMADLQAALDRDVFVARRQLLQSADPALIAKQQSLRAERLGYCESISDHDNEIATLESLIGSSCPDADKAHLAKIKQHQSDIALLRAAVQECDAELLTLEAKKLLSDPDGAPPGWLLDAVQAMQIKRS